MIRTAAAIAALLWVTSAHSQSPAPTAALKAELDRIGQEANAEMNGPNVDEAARICRRIAGVSVPAKTAKDVVAAGYSPEVAFQFIDCLMNLMYPVDAKKTEELDRKIGSR